MATQPSVDKLEIAVLDAADMALQLELGVRILQETENPLGERGILVTRYSAQEFTLELHECVPFGFTQELDTWVRQNVGGTGRTTDAGRAPRTQ
jgi:hypothetical protein